VRVALSYALVMLTGVTLCCGRGPSPLPALCALHLHCSRFLGCLDAAKQKLLDMGFQDLVFEDALELLQSQVRAMMSMGPGKQVSAQGLRGSSRVSPGV
jgi:hypothetical protein